VLEIGKAKDLSAPLSSLTTGGAVKTPLKSDMYGRPFTFLAMLEQHLQHQKGTLMLNIVCKYFGS
jgi:hypothetical protein